MVAITTRAAKGSPLTNTEMDANLTNLNDGKVETTAVGTIASQNANNVAITGGSITGITDLTVADGGTGRSTLTAENVLLGGGTNPVKFVAPGASGNLLTSNGTTWTSAAPPTPVTAGSGISVAGTTVSIDTNNALGVGAYAMLRPATTVTNGSTTTSVSAAYWRGASNSWSTTVISGTWRNVSGNTITDEDIGLFIRTA